MKLSELLDVLYGETIIELCIDFVPVYTGTAEYAKDRKYSVRFVKEVYIDISGEKLIIHISGRP